MWLFHVFIEFTLDIFALIINTVSSWISKDTNLWIFGTWSGESYNDNSKYLFEYVQQQYPKIRCVWMAKKTNVIKRIRKRGYEAYDMHGPYGIWLTMRAGFAICSVSKTFDFYNPAISAKTKCINLTHGIGPKVMTLKKSYVPTEYKDLVRVTYKKLALRIARHIFPNVDRNNLILNHENWDRYDLITALSVTAKKKIIDTFHLQPNKIIPTGYPRNDIFFSNKPSSLPIDPLLEKLKKNNIKIGLYAPTYRKEGKVNIVNLFVTAAEELGLRLQKDGIYLFVKLHNWDRNDVRYTNARLRHIHILSDKEIDQDIYPFLPQTNFLITDYSSIYTDYLLLDKPIIFTPFDREEYENSDRGFYYPYENVTPGPKVKNWDEAYGAIREAISHPDKYKVERRRIKQFFHDFDKGGSRERICSVANLTT